MALVGVPFVYKKHHGCVANLPRNMLATLPLTFPRQERMGQASGRLSTEEREALQKELEDSAHSLGRFQLPADLEQKMGEFLGEKTLEV